MGSDDEGNPVSTSRIVFSGRGTYGSPSSRDAERAGRAGQVIDAVVAISLPTSTTVQPGDVADLRGETWTVLWVSDVRLHYRVALTRAA